MKTFTLSRLFLTGAIFLSSAVVGESKDSNQKNRGKGDSNRSERPKVESYHRGLYSNRGDSNRGDSNRGDSNKGNSHRDGSDRGDSHRDSSHRHYSNYYRGGYYRGGYGYSPYYYNRPRTSISVGIGSGFYNNGYYGGGYNTSYYGDDDRPVYRGRAISEGRDSSLEVSVQRKLAQLGYYKGSLDGNIGPASRQAILRYQRDNELDETGRINSELVEELGLS